MGEYRTIKLTEALDVTVTPSNVATVWNGDTPARSLPPVRITYNYAAGDTNNYTVTREGTSAVEFIITSWIHSRHITHIEFI